MKRIQAGTIAVVAGTGIGLVWAGAGEGAAAWFLLPFTILPAMLTATLAVAACEGLTGKLSVPPRLLAVICGVVAFWFLIRAGVGEDVMRWGSLSARIVASAAASTIYLALYAMPEARAAQGRPPWLLVGVAGVVAGVAGLVSGLLAIWVLLGGAEHPEAAPWTLILAIFFLAPILFALPLAVAAAELVVRNSGVSRGLAALFAVLPAMFYFLVTPYRLGNLPAEATNALTFAACFLIPFSVAAATHLILTWESLFAMRTQRPNVPPAPPLPAPPTPPPSVRPREPSLFAPVVLETPPTSEELISILTSPNHRIGQRLQMYAMQIWGLAASVWFPLPFVAGALLGLDQEVRVIIAELGWLALFWSAFCIAANRLRDLHVESAWGALPMVAAVLWLMLEGEPEQGWLSVTAVHHWMIATVFCYGATGAVLLLLKGDPVGQRGPRA